MVVHEHYEAEEKLLVSGKSNSGPLVQIGCVAVAVAVAVGVGGGARVTIAVVNATAIAVIVVIVVRVFCASIGKWCSTSVSRLTRAPRSHSLFQLALLRCIGATANADIIIDVDMRVCVCGSAWCHALVLGL